MHVIETYPEMNKQIKSLLMLSDEPTHQYAAKRIGELEAEVERLEAENLRLVMLPSSRYEMLVEVLRWYADNEAYSIPHIGCTSKVMADRGKRASDALKELGIEVGK